MEGRGGGEGEKHPFHSGHFCRGESWGLDSTPCPRKNNKFISWHLQCSVAHPEPRHTNASQGPKVTVFSFPFAAAPRAIVWLRATQRTSRKLTLRSHVHQPCLPASQPSSSGQEGDECVAGWLVGVGVPPRINSHYVHLGPQKTSLSSLQRPERLSGWSPGL